jgi:hypothetical protein
LGELLEPETFSGKFGHSAAYPKRKSSEQGQQGPGTVVERQLKGAGAFQGVSKREKGEKEN